MSEFKELIHKISAKDSSISQMEEVTEILDGLFDELHENHLTIYNKYILKLEDIACRITEDKAKEIVRAMKPYGEKWSPHTIKELLEYNNIDNHIIDYYLVMNMAYNDHLELAKSVQKENDVNFFLQFAKDFINDVDAKPHKVAKYFLK